MTEKMIIEDYKNTIHRLQNECTEKIDLIMKTKAQYNAVLEQNKSLQTELKQKEQECEELKESVMKQCPICGETFLSPIGMELYDKNTSYKQALDEIEDLAIKNLEKHYNHCKYAKGCVNPCGINNEVNLNQILNIIKKAKGKNDE